jgi:hypothetical protein
MRRVIAGSWLSILALARCNSGDGATPDAAVATVPAPAPAPATACQAAQGRAWRGAVQLAPVDQPGSTLTEAYIDDAANAMVTGAGLASAQFFGAREGTWGPPEFFADEGAAFAMVGSGDALRIAGKAQDVSARWYRAATGTWGPLSLLSQSATSKMVTFGSDGAGNVLTVWDDRAPASLDTGVVASISYDKAKDRWSPAVVINAGSANPWMNLLLEVNRQTDAALFWLLQDTAQAPNLVGSLQMLRWIRASDSWQAPPIQIPGASQLLTGQFDAALTDDGSVFVVYSPFDPSGSATTVYAVRGAAGTWDAPVAIAPGSNPHLSTSGSNVVASWVVSGSAGPELHLARLESGNRWTEILPMPSLSSASAVLVDAAGNIFVSYGTIVDSKLTSGAVRFYAAANQWASVVTFGPNSRGATVRMAPCGWAIAAWTECADWGSGKNEPLRLPSGCAHWANMFK